MNYLLDTNTVERVERVRNAEGAMCRYDLRIEEELTLDALLWDLSR